MNVNAEYAHQFLDEVYQTLGYQEETLFNAVQTPQPFSKEANRWIDIGDWLVTAKKVNAEKVFFVNNDPVLVFSAYEQNLDENEILNTFRRVWCMARPQRFFLSLPGELRIYDLKESPIKNDGKYVEPLSIAYNIADVLEKLQDYRREQLEAGYLPENERLFEKKDERADRRLIQDLKSVRNSLRNAGLNLEHAHALIGRSIFIRYLEDRGVLTEAYFRQVAENQSEWAELLERNLEKLAIQNILQESELKKRKYYNVLLNKDFTYALFAQLAQDFNGDLFPKDDAEKEAVEQPHLDLLRKFLLGDADQNQQNLFFWVYDFEIIPIELISSIYEEFYHHEDNGEDNATHYTPSVLVEFMLSHVLPEERLAMAPKILDPACGSGIFLVEAFRRIVRYRIKAKGESLSAIELREILHKQIRGIEINSGAIYVAAFSLYLALLHYQKPPDILAQIEIPQSAKPLPHLIFDEDHLQDNNYYHILFNVNTFALMDIERTQLNQESEIHPRQTRLKNFYETSDRLVIEPNSFDLIIGNPPWGFVKKNQSSAEIRKAQTQVQEWCQRFGWSIGDKELSQAFIARSLSLLKPDGECGFLVSTGVFFKGHVNSQKFRQRWLAESTIKIVVNFAHVREIYFNGAISPFAFVHYKASRAEINHRIQYWSAKRTQIVEDSQSVVLHRSDIKAIHQHDLEQNEQLWKVYWWGDHRDAALINILNLDKSLEKLVDERFWDNGQGYTPGSTSFGNQAVYKLTQQAYHKLSRENIPSEILAKIKPLRRRNNESKEEKFLRILEKTLGKDLSDIYSSLIMEYARNYLTNYNELSIKDNFRRYGPITQDDLEVIPHKVHRHGNFGVYEGWRLIIKRGITQEEEANGRIDSRLEHISCCFRNSAHGVNLNEAEDWERKTLIGILWSSLARYYYFMTVGSWITWHCEIHFAPVMNLPIRFPEDLEIRQRIVQIVDQLQSWNPDHRSIFKPEGQTKRDISDQLMLLERELDEAIFDLYELSEPERDLILDMCETGLEFFYRHSQSHAVQPVEAYPSQIQGIIQDLPQRRDIERGLEGYLYAFLDMWNDELEPDGEFRWRIIRPTKNPMLAVVFTTQNKGSSLPELTSSDEEWTTVLDKVDKLSKHCISRNIYLDGIIRRVTDTEIFIIKRNERRLWTRSLAREDAEATLLQATYL